MIQRALILLAGAVALLWLAGLIVFVARVGAMNGPVINADLQPADAVVVLTGGSERVTTGLALLKAGKGKKLLISGVHPRLTLDGLLAAQPVPKELRDCCIILGHTAESTLGNAEETLTWLTLESDHSMFLVTANYHMPRSLLIFHAAMPDINISAYPVTPESVKLDGWWARPGTANLLVTEYNKYLWTFVWLWLGHNIGA